LVVGLVSAYRIREVDAFDDDVEQTITALHKLFTEFPPLGSHYFENGYWWLATLSGEPVAFAGLIPSTRWANCGYFVRSGVLPEHRGNGLQRRLMRVREIKAKRLGWTHMISDCTDNLHSANNFIRSGYSLYEPSRPWGFARTLYWRKIL
jgi:GNAT superfamily N-acetyltransferase